MLRKPHKLRVVVLGAGFCLLAMAVGGRLFDLQVRDHAGLAERAARQQTKSFVLQPERGDILDRRERPLATSTGTLSLYVNPSFFREPEADVDLIALGRQISFYTGMPADRVTTRLRGSLVTDLGRQLNPEHAQKAAALLDEYGISRRGFWLYRESKRQYPRNLAPHIIGFCGTDGDGDNQGLAGIEFSHNSWLQGNRIEGRTSRSGINQAMEPFDYSDLVQARGHTLVLTIDATIQQAAEEALAEAAQLNDADSCGAVIMDVETGAILAMASWPSFQNSDFRNAPTENQRNRILTDPLETGSVAKLFTAAALIDLGLVAPDTIVSCNGGYAVFGRREIRDSPGHRLWDAPFYEVMRWSSNVGITRAAQTLDNEQWYQYLRNFGFGERTGIDLPGEGEGILYPPHRWTSYSRTSLPMGYEMALTPIQIVSGIAALVNGGELLQPHIIKEVRDARGNVVAVTPPTVRHRVIRPTTSLVMREMMEDVVLHGTGRRAQIPGFRVGGKTGTTRKSHITTHREYIASFGGAFPMENPRVAVYVYVDNPKDAYYAGEVAAPVFRRIAGAVVLQLGLVPSFQQVASGLEVPRALNPIPTPASNDDGTLPGLLAGMPDLSGLTMAQVRRRMSPVLENVRFAGSGVVVDQSPLPGSPLERSTDVVIVFGSSASEPAHSAAAVSTASRSTR